MMKQFDVQKAQTGVFNKYGVFFAFSRQQFDEQRADGVKYESLGQGMYAPVGKAAEVFEALSKLNDQKIAYELENNSLKDIIWDSLANYECQISMSVEDALEHLEEYGISHEQIMAEWVAYYQHCVDNDCF